MEVDEQRFVELAPKGKGLEKSQHRYDDETKWRTVKRQPSAARKQQQRGIARSRATTDEGVSTRKTRRMSDASDGAEERQRQEETPAGVRTRRRRSNIADSGAAAAARQQSGGSRKRARSASARSAKGSEADDTVEDSEDQSQVF